MQHGFQGDMSRQYLSTAQSAALRERLYAVFRSHSLRARTGRLVLFTCAHIFLTSPLSAMALVEHGFLKQKPLNFTA